MCGTTCATEACGNDGGDPHAGGGQEWLQHSRRRQGLRVVQPADALQRLVVTLRATACSAKMMVVPVRVMHLGDVYCL